MNRIPKVACIIILLAVLCWGCGKSYAVELELELMGTNTATSERLEKLKDWNPKYTDNQVETYHIYETLLIVIKTEEMYSYVDWRILGVSNWIKKDFEESISCFRNALKKTPDGKESIRLGLWLSHALFKAERYAEAIKLDKLLEPYEFKRR